MPFKFEKIDIWNLSIVFADDVHNVTRKFPKEEMFSLTSQFKRAADSISLNISEGSIGQSNGEQRKFIGYAIRSIAECVTCLYLALRRQYLSRSEFDILYREAEIMMGRTVTFRNGIPTKLIRRTKDER